MYCKSFLLQIIVYNVVDAMKYNGEPAVTCQTLFNILDFAILCHYNHGKCYLQVHDVVAKHYSQ